MRKPARIAAVVSALVLSPMAIPQASAKLDQIREDELPPTLRALPKPQRSAALEQQSNERKELNAKLADLVAKRDAYIAEQRGKLHPKTSSFDQAVAATLKAQIR